MITALLETLTEAGKPPEVIMDAAGARIVILPYGGRVLGLVPPGSDESFFWVHPALQSVAAATKLYASDAWHNSGGDRHWIAPEADFFFPQWPRTDVYCPPRQLDPGEYTLERAGLLVRLAARFSLHSHRTGADVSLAIIKLVKPAANPLRNVDGLVRPGALSYAGYTLRTTLELGGGGRTVTRAGLWALLQLPHGGEMLIPTYAWARPVAYFGQPVASGLTVEERLIRWPMRGKGEHKLGVRVAGCTGRMGYVWRSGEAWQLVVRAFPVDPGGDYIDVPSNAPDQEGCAVQGCAVNSPTQGCFSEIEYHSPAIGSPVGSGRCEDVSHVWAFRGPEGAIRTAAHVLLGFEA